MVKSRKCNEIKLSEDVGTASRLRLKEHFVGTRPGGDDVGKAASPNPPALVCGSPRPASRPGSRMHCQINPRMKDGSTCDTLASGSFDEVCEQLYLRLRWGTSRLSLSPEAI